MPPTLPNTWPSRESHSGRLTPSWAYGKTCETKGCDFEDLTAEDLAAIDSRVTPESLGDISIKSCVDARMSFGGTAPAEVRRQIAVGREWLESLNLAESREKGDIVCPMRAQYFLGELALGLASFCGASFRSPQMKTTTTNRTGGICLRSCFYPLSTVGRLAYQADSSAKFPV